jgi:hypothetical protein
VLAGGNRRGVDHRPEPGRGGGDNQVRTGGNRFLKAIQSAEHPVIRQVHSVRAFLAQSPSRALDAVFECVRHGDDPNARIGAHAVFDRPVAAAAATDQGGLNHVAAGGVGHPGDADLAGHGNACCNRGRPLQEIASRCIRLVAHQLCSLNKIKANRPARNIQAGISKIVPCGRSGGKYG